MTDDAILKIDYLPYMYIVIVLNAIACDWAGMVWNGIKT